MILVALVLLVIILLIYYFFGPIKNTAAEMFGMKYLVLHYSHTCPHCVHTYPEWKKAVPTLTAMGFKCSEDDGPYAGPVPTVELNGKPVQVGSFDVQKIISVCKPLA